jgi:hypothetical protein
MLLSLSTKRLCFLDLLLLHHCFRMAQPDTPPCLYLLLDRPHVEVAHRPTIVPIVVGRAASEAADFDRDSINMSMKMNVPLMGPNT